MRAGAARGLADATQGLDARGLHGVGIEDGGRGLLAATLRAGERGGLDRGADGDDLVRVHAVHGLLGEGLLHAPPHERDAGAAADEDDVVEGVVLEARELERVVAHAEAAVDERHRDLLELRAAHDERDVDRPAARAVAELLELDAHVVLLGERDLHLLGGGAQALHDLHVGARVEAGLLDDVERDAVGDELVDVVAAEEAVAGGGDDLEDVAREIEEGEVERAAAEVVDRDALVAALAEAVGEGRGGGLVEDAEHLEAGLARGDLGGGALQVVERGGHRDDGALDRLTEGGLGDGLGAPEHEGADLGQRVGLAARDDERAVGRALAELEGEALPCALDLVALPRATDEALDAVDGVAGVDEPPLARLVADEHLAGWVERDHAREEAVALLVGEDHGLAAPHHGDDGVRGAEIDADDRPCHCPWIPITGTRRGEFCSRGWLISPWRAPSCRPTRRH